jgi:hypothetical protein
MALTIDRSTGVFAADELRCMRQIRLLATGIHREEAPHDDATARFRAAQALPHGVLIERVEAIVDCDLVTRSNRGPREDLDAVPHGIRFT